MFLRSYLAVSVASLRECMIRQVIIKTSAPDLGSAVKKDVRVYTEMAVKHGGPLLNL